MGVVSYSVLPKSNSSGCSFYVFAECLRKGWFANGIFPNVVPYEQFQYTQRIELRPRFLVTRQLEKIYNIEMIIGAFKEVQQIFQSASLTIAGSGTQKDQLERIALEMELKNVSFCGFVEHDELPAVYAEHDILLNASTEDNFPGSLVEAACSGLPIISTASGGIPDMLVSGYNGILIPRGDQAALASAMITLLNHPACGIQMARNARHWVESFSWFEIFGRWQKFLLCGAQIQPSVSPVCDNESAIHWLRV